MPYTSPAITGDLIVSRSPTEILEVMGSRSAIAFSISSTATSTATQSNTQSNTSTSTQCHCAADVLMG